MPHHVGRITFADGGAIKRTTKYPPVGTYHLDAGEMLKSGNETNFRVEGLLRSTGLWVAFGSFDEWDDANDVINDLYKSAETWIVIPNARVKREEFSAYRVEKITTFRWLK